RDCLYRTATSAFRTLYLPDALPILRKRGGNVPQPSAPLAIVKRHDIATGEIAADRAHVTGGEIDLEKLGDDEPAFLRGNTNFQEDRKSTRLHSSHVQSSYAVCCLNI